MGKREKRLLIRFLHAPVHVTVPAEFRQQARTRPGQNTFISKTFFCAGSAFLQSYRNDTVFPGFGKSLVFQPVLKTFLIIQASERQLSPASSDMKGKKNAARGAAPECAFT